MMVECNYEINVARETGKVYPKYSHYCKIELGAGLEENALKKFDEIKKRFPYPEFKLSLQYIECYGEFLAET